MIGNEDCRVVLENLPTDIRGFVVKSDEDFYTIVLNARHSYEMNKKTFLHELKHIANGDFYDDLTADDLEDYRH